MSTIGLQVYPPPPPVPSMQQNTFACLSLMIMRIRISLDSSARYQDQISHYSPDPYRRTWGKSRDRSEDTKLPVWAIWVSKKLIFC